MHKAIETFSQVIKVGIETALKSAANEEKNGYWQARLFDLYLFCFSLLVHLVASLEYLMPALNGRLSELLALTQFLNYANITVLTLVTLERTINRLSFFYVDDDHVRTIDLRARITCPVG